MSNKTRIFRRTLKICGSTLLGAALMTAAALAMGWATFVEREMGTPVAQRIIYASNWFYVLIGALGLNVLCSALVRLPAFIRRVPVDATSADAATSDATSPRRPTKIVVERRLIPFYLAHLGILVLLAGCLATALCGTQARMTIPEGTAVEKALDVNARLFDVELVDLTSPPESQPKELDIPFSGGPLNWRDCASYNAWKTNVSEPLLAKMSDGSFFKDLAKGAARWSQKAAFVAANISRTQKSGTIYDRDGFKIEVLDYATIYDFAPVEPLAATLTLKKPDGKTVVEKIELAFPNDATPQTDALSVSRRAVRQTLTDGVRVVYMLADSNAEADAFLKTVPTKDAAPASQPSETDASESVAAQNVNKNDVVVLSVDGERFQIPLPDLAPLAYSGSSDEQRASLETQKTEIERRLDLERNRKDATPDNAAELKPLQTVKREDLERNATELSELLRSTNELLAASADEKENAEENSALVEARQKYSQRRLLNYLASAWAQLENASATSKEFCDALEKMLNDTTSRLAELDRLDAVSRLGETGWRIVGFETSPTLVSNVDELQGWTALIQLESPQGDKCETTLFSELAERNRYPENGRVFGALWLDRFQGSDSEYGRPWNPSLSKPKLELAQTPDGALYYRYNNGLNEFQTGRLETKTLSAETETIAAANVALTAVATPGDSTAPTAFTLDKVGLQTELGYRFTPGAFAQDKANEFYGTAKVRVTLDDAVETFWIRTIPLESVSEEQLKYLTKRVVSSKRAATIRLTDRELDLGVALFVKKFTPVYEPGSTTAASFSSLVRVLPQGLSAEEQASELAKNADADVLIQMNRPGVLRSPQTGRAFWAYQDSFRGPFRPGDPEFEQVVDGRLLPGETTPRETLYSTTITLNDDPGRGLKYLGSLLIVLGTAFLIYRKSSKSATMNSSNATSSTNKTSNVKTLASTLAFLTATLFASATFAQEASQSQPVKGKDVASASVVLNTSEAAKNFAMTNAQIDWETWRLLPVFADGRRQPLNTFAEILVRDVCGTATPVFAVPEETLTRLESGKPLNFPTLEEVLKEVAPEKRAERTAAFNEISAGVVERQRKIAAQLRATFPNGTRRFEAPEILFSWLAEPEIWDYVPFIADAQAEVSQGVFARSSLEIASRFSRLAPEDFERLDEESGRPVVENFRATSGQNSPEIAKALAEAERRLTLFRSVSFVPTQSPSTRPSRYLQRILYGAPASGSPHSGMSPSTSPLAKLDAATRNLERLISTTDKDLRSESPFSDGDFLLRQTEKFSQNGREVEALKLAKAFYLLEMQNVATPTPANGERFETLTVAVGSALSELREHRDAIFVAGTFSDEYRRELLKCVDALSEIADTLELAYLSTTSELPKTLDVVPVVRRREFRLTESQESPWVPLQTLLWAPDSLFVRFVDPSLAPKLQQLAQTPTPPESTPRRKRETPPTLDEQTISPFATFDEALRKTLDLSVYERPAAAAFLDAALAYRDVSAPDRAERFNASLDRFAAELRALAERSESFRVALATEEVADERLRMSFLDKTSYPEPDALDAEFLYNRLNPFYWNWVACLFAVAALAASYCRQTFVRLRRRAVPQTENVPKQTLTSFNVSNATPFEERFFFVVGFAFLALSCAVAFLGGAIRAYITGWAPVTNMFETVVLLAFMIAAIAIGYALFPAWGRPFANAWRVSAFPGRLRDATSEELRVSRLLRWPRIVTIVLCVVAALRLCYREEMFHSGDTLSRVILESFAMQGILDRCAILGTFVFIAWSVPRFLAAVAALVFFPKTTLCRDDLRAEISDEFPNVAERRAAFRRLIASQIVQRKAFLTASSVVALLVAAAAYFNSSEFNPNIRPLAAVLRSNFWLTIHVFAIIASYALGAIAWAVALTSLTAYIFGRYAPRQSAPTLTATSRRERRRAKKNADANLSRLAASNAPDDWEPAYCRRVSGIIATMIRSAVLFLTIGIILGARWADFSWGRFWSWDPKEVWALVTLLIYLVVLHVLKVRRCGRFGLAVGATLGALAIVMTWYGLSFVMGGGGRHSYAAGESNKVAVLYLLFAANLLWTFVATVRYQIAKAGRKTGADKR
ncbi:MAG: cytochrome c biogenesis protein CcsA [Thermoguttaceae bacterium]|nr:cytochrome c biogenesis protein CcsA [Thermoguttaceae bacterium]MBQ7111735.1 cytochrome c biogenesis protein CcsA [Thermoguttaceae bacterium]